MKKKSIKQEYKEEREKAYSNLVREINLLDIKLVQKERLIKLIKEFERTVECDASYVEPSTPNNGW